MSAIRLLLLVTALSSLAPTVGVAKPIAEVERVTPRHHLRLLNGSRLLIRASVNGHPVEAVLDSAAELTILDRAFAKALGLGHGKHVAGQGSGAESFDAETSNNVTISAVGRSLKNQMVAVADLTDISKRLFGRPVNVILGREIFDASRPTIDIQGGWIAVTPAADTPPGVRLDLTTENGVETIPVRVEGADDARATFDLGNGSGVLVSRAFVERRNFLSDGRAVNPVKGGGLGGEATRQVFTLRNIEIAGQRFENIDATIDPQPSASDVNVGVALLRHFVITTDFAAHVVWMAPRL